MGVWADHGTLEPALPDTSRRCTRAMIVPGVRHRQRLQNAADALPGVRPQNQVEVIAHQTKRVESERIAAFSLCQRLQEELIVCRFKKYRRSVVASIERVVDQAIGNQPQGTS